jgi:hypothetical protein
LQKKKSKLKWSYFIKNNFLIMTKTDLIAAIAAKANLTKKDAAEAVSAFIETVTSELVN